MKLLGTIKGVVLVWNNLVVIMTEVLPYYVLWTNSIAWLVYKITSEAATSCWDLDMEMLNLVWIMQYKRDLWWEIEANLGL